jgi:ATP-binding cassette subfamily B (MDR/TAP) protein 1
MFAGLYQFILFGSMGIAFWFGCLFKLLNPKFRYGVKLVLDGYMSPGAVFSCFWAVCGGANRLGQAIPQFNVLMQAKMAAGEILSIIDLKPKLDCASTKGDKLDDVKGRIEFNDVSFKCAIITM